MQSLLLRVLVSGWSRSVEPSAAEGWAERVWMGKLKPNQIQLNLELRSWQCTDTHPYAHTPFRVSAVFTHSWGSTPDSRRSWSLSQRTKSICPQMLRLKHTTTLLWPFQLLTAPAVIQRVFRNTRTHPLFAVTTVSKLKINQGIPAD